MPRFEYSWRFVNISPSWRGGIYDAVRGYDGIEMAVCKELRSFSLPKYWEAEVGIGEKWNMEGKGTSFSQSQILDVISKART